ncbi:MAG: hypothetical protein IKS42_07980 [Oscillospiraceae bacterium]|nr:hypothetical protein [Oscillospiraceae bacterium]
MERAMKKRLAALCLLALTAGMLTACGGSGSGNAGKKGKNSEAETVPEDDLDTATYLKEHGKVLHKTAAEKSKKVKSERTVTKMIADRGFEDLPLETTYSMEGEYSESIEIKADGTEKHPIYTGLYVTEAGNYWNIYVVNGSIFADPLFYNFDPDGMPAVQTVLSESKTITNYDSATNQFFEYVPDAAELRVITVEKIDAETLESMTKEALEG